MACNSDYLGATNIELNLSQVLCLLKELKTGVPVDTTSPKWRGYHKKAYGVSTKSKLDEKVAKLCAKLHEVKDITKYSLEMQSWWRDHQRADAERMKLEQEPSAIPGLGFSIEELPTAVHYLGVNNRGTYIFFDAHAGSVYRWNPNTGYFRRNSSHTLDGRNTLVVKNRIETLTLKTLVHYMESYRNNLRKTQKNSKQHYNVMWS